jgi:hypothetical protein
MFLTNGHRLPHRSNGNINGTVLRSAPIKTETKAPSALNAPLIERVHSVRPGCGSCGR